MTSRWIGKLGAIHQYENVPYVVLGLDGYVVCQLCGTGSMNMDNLIRHVHGACHEKKYKAVQKLETNHAEALQNLKAPQENVGRIHQHEKHSYFVKDCNGLVVCQLCGTGSMGNDQLIRHLRGARHERKEKQHTEALQSSKSAQQIVADSNLIDIGAKWECSVDGEWVEYPEYICQFLEECYNQGAKASFDPYEIDFGAENLEQVNVNTASRRPVRRQEEWKEVANSKPISDTVKWEVEMNGEWVEYPTQTCFILELSFQQKSKITFSLDETNYVIDFSAKKPEEVNIATKCQRPIRRKEVEAASKNSSLPSTWNKDLLVGGSEWNYVEGQLKKTLPNAELQDICRIENRHLWEYFCFRKERTMKLSGGADPNIVSVWHGTSENDPSVICEDIADGFMMQYSRTGMWGRGIYFAANASYSNKYAYISSPSNPKTKSMILAKLVVGMEKELSPDRSLIVCPERPDGKGRYDTVTGTTLGSKVYIVYENGRAYPEYIVTYVDH